MSETSKFGLLEQQIQYQFKDSELLVLALTHKSYSNELNSQGLNNERLEFLGDAVLDFVMSDFLMDLFPQDNEGNLSKKRASLVNEEVLAQIAQKLEIDKYLRLGKGEDQQGGRSKPRLLASTFEALIGAVYKDGGFEIANDILRKLFAGQIQNTSTIHDFESDYKTRFQEFTQKKYKTTPTYTLISETGPSHDPCFEVEVKLNEKNKFIGQGKSKKAAEQKAAQVALQKLKERE